MIYQNITDTYILLSLLNVPTFFSKWKLVFDLLKYTCFFWFLFIFKHLLLKYWFFRNCIIYRNNKEVFRFLILIHFHLKFIDRNEWVILVEIKDIEEFLCYNTPFIVFILETLLLNRIMRIWTLALLFNLKLFQILLQLFDLIFWKLQSCKRFKLYKVEKNLIKLSLPTHNIQYLRHIVFKL